MMGKDEREEPQEMHFQGMPFYLGGKEPTRPNTNRLNAAIDLLRQALAEPGLSYFAGNRIERALNELKAERAEKQAEIAKLPKKPSCQKCGSEDLMAAGHAATFRGILYFPAQCGHCREPVNLTPADHKET
jgi:hypothetical protein